MKYFIIIIITLILLLFVFVYNPYLGVYKNKVTIEYSFNEDNYSWQYECDCDSFKIEQINDEKWELSIKKNGTCNLIFNYVNYTDKSIKYSIKYLFKIKKNKIYWIEGEGDGLLYYPNPY